MFDERFNVRVEDFDIYCSTVIWFLFIFCKLMIYPVSIFLHVTEMIPTHICQSHFWSYQRFSDKDLKHHKQSSHHFAPKTWWNGLAVEGQSSESGLLIPAALWLTDTMQLEVQNKWAVITAVFPGLFCLWPERGWCGGWGWVQNSLGSKWTECNNLITGEPIINPERAACGYHYHSPNN